MNWLRYLKYDPIQPLLESDNNALTYFTNRDLLDKQVQPISYIWDLPEVNKIIKKQVEGGYWASKKNTENTIQNYSLIETWKQFRFLVEKYEMNKSHQCIERAAEFLFSCQKEEGDIRGFLGNQYTTYYTGAILYLLIKAGYENDPRVEKGIKWLLSMRQDDGGWVGSPVWTLDNVSWTERIELITKDIKTLKEWDRTRPLCLNSTGMVIRAFAVHPKYKKSEEARKAARLLKQHFFMENYYTSYKHKDHWLCFQYPFWWNNLVSALDSIIKIYPEKDDKDIENAVNWLIDHQENTGLWKISYSKIHKNTVTQKTKEAELWITLVICRILKKYIYYKK